MFIDTHCHLTMLVSRATSKESWESSLSGELSPEDVRDLTLLLGESKDSGVEKIISISTRLLDSLRTIEIAKKFDNVFATVGIHPCDCTSDWRDDFSKLEVFVKNNRENKIIGLGETGLDFYHKPFNKQRQVDAFTAHIECALENSLPVVVHIRDSADESLKILEEYKKDLTGVAHCFSQGPDIAKILIDFGFYLGFGGPITYPKNNKLRDMIKNIPLNKILLETDAPFLTPQKFRGQQNFPKYIPLIAQEIARIKDIDPEEVGRVTTDNVKKLFGV